MSITRVSYALATFIGIVGYAASPAVALPLISSLVENGAMLDPASAVVSSATSPGPGGTSGALLNESFQFADRTHEFTNARTNAAGVLTTAESGTLRAFPHYLLGLEYIQISNDNREDTDYSLDVTLSAPVTAFLMLDNRNNGPASMNNDPNTNDPILGGPLQWVIDDGWARVNSGIMPNGQADYVGSDEGAAVATDNPAERVHTGAGNVAGPGNGLNQFYAIYRKNFPAGQHIGFTKANGIPGGATYSVAVGPTIGPIVPGDVNNNGVADINDYVIIRNNFNKPGNHNQGDLSGDGTVNFTDFRLWKNFRTAGAGADIGLEAALGGVPEPGSVGLALLGTVVFAGATTRRRGH